MKISRIFFFSIFCNILLVKKINFEMFFRKEFFSVNFFQKMFISVSSFRKFSFHEKICFWNFLIMRFRRKRLEKQTHIDNFFLKKNP